MRLGFLASLALVSILSWSCGSSDGGSGGGGTPGSDNPDLNDGGQRPVNCENAWTAYVKSHPKGLKLKYQTNGAGQLQIFTNEVTASNEEAITETYRGTSGSNETTITKAEFLNSCKQGTGNPSDQPRGTLEESKKTTIKVRAGEFKTNYVRYRMEMDTETTSLSEVWSSDDSYHFLVKQITTTEVSGTRYEVTTELLEARIP